MTLTKQNILNYREKLVREIKALDIVISLFQGEPKSIGLKQAKILKEVKESRRKKLHWTQTVAGRKKMSRIQKLAWKNREKS